MKTSAADQKVDYRLLGCLSRLVICAACLRAGKITPVPQIFSRRHRPRALCGDCAGPQQPGSGRKIARLATRR